MEVPLRLPFFAFAHSKPSDLMRNDPLNVAVKLIIQVEFHLNGECSHS